MKITNINVDDVIRQRKKEGVDRIVWEGDDLKVFRAFVRAVFNFNGFRLPHSFPNGEMFMGVKHYKSKQNK